jgi:hypothetical protein
MEGKIFVDAGLSSNDRLLHGVELSLDGLQIRFGSTHGSVLGSARLHGH